MTSSSDNPDKKNFKEIEEDSAIKRDQTRMLKETQLDFIVDSFVYGIYQVTLTDTNEREFTYVNKAYESLYGASAEEIMQDASIVYSRIHPDDVDDLIAKEEEAIQSMSVFETEARIYNTDGSIRWVHLISKPQQLEGAIVFDGIELDITKQKLLEIELTQAKEKAEKNERELKKVQEITNVGSWFLDVKTNEVVWTEELYKMYGIDPKNPVPPFPEHIQYFTSKSWELLSASLELTRTKGIPYELELQMLRKDGSNGWMWVRGEAIKENGEIVKLWGAAQDISERKLAEKALRGSEEMLLSSQSVANICSYSTNLNVTEIDKSQWVCSPEFYKIFGIDKSYPHTIEGWVGFIHPDFREDLVAYHESVVKERSSFNREYKIIRINDGEERWVHGTGELVYDNDGNPERMHGAIQDITERKQHELALIESETRFKALHNASFGGIAIHDNGLILDCNYGLSKLTGYSQSELIGMNGLLLISENTRDRVVRNISTGYEKLYEAEGVRKNGEKFPMQIEARQIPYKGKNIRVVEFREITQQKKIEQELIFAKEKAEESDRLKTEFINNMSHEIRTPMNGILGFSKFLGDNDVSVEERKNYIKIIQNSGFQLLRVIDDILEISRLGTKQVQAIEEVVCLNDFLLEKFSVFDLKAKDNSTPLYLKKGLLNDESCIISDKSKLNKIISNLLDNALKFTHKGYIEFGYCLKGSMLELYVKDTGIGVNKDKQSQIFDRFSQEEKELSRSVGGLGLGLSIAKENAELLGGKISLESEKGKGSTFFITIPYKPSDLDREAPVGGKLDGTQDRFTLLIAEDEEVNYLFLEALIEHEFGPSCHIINSINGKDTVDVCKENEAIDLVLMDLKMPVMNGYEATKIIKDLRHDLPIIAQTAYTSRDDREKAKEAGCDEFISKPINKKELFDLIEKCLKK